MRAIALILLLVWGCGGSSEDDGSGGAAGASGSGGSAASGGSGGSSGGGAASGSGGAGGGAGAGRCLLPADTGPCDGAFRRWFFNAQTGKCEPFSYGGCQGNANNFERPGECVQACAPSAEHPCLAIDCGGSALCVYTGPTSAPTCAAPCDAAGACPAGQSCDCGASCPGCKDCVQACFGQD